MAKPSIVLAKLLGEFRKHSIVYAVTVACNTEKPTEEDLHKGMQLIMNLYQPLRMLYVIEEGMYRGLHIHGYLEASHIITLGKVIKGYHVYFRRVKLPHQKTENKSFMGVENLPKKVQLLMQRDVSTGMETSEGWNKYIMKSDPKKIYYLKKGKGLFIYNPYSWEGVVIVGKGV